MATRKLNVIEKLAVTFGPVYRYQKLQFPRRFAIFKKVAQRELAPPTSKDWPAIKKDFSAIANAIETKAYRNFTVAETLVYAAVCFEVICWFFLGECIGRRNLIGYVVAEDYVSKKIQKEADALVIEDKTRL